MWDAQQYLEFRPWEKCLRILLVIYAETVSLLKKTSTCFNNLQESYKTKINKRTTCRYPLLHKIHTTATKEKTWFLDRWISYKKVLCRPKKAYNRNNQLREKEMLPLTMNEGKKHKNQNLFTIYKQEFNDMFNKDENYHRVLDHCHYTEKHRGVTHKIRNSRHKTPEEFPVGFHNGSNHDSHFMIKKTSKSIQRTVRVLTGKHW